mmetsp:Transcript_429/g.1189  ORF Transcript_429/g.1189 Transcript_429/m.1189 type:complete len:219 (-) Transcript_429:133-789(-)
MARGAAAPRVRRGAASPRAGTDSGWGGLLSAPRPPLGQAVAVVVRRGQWVRFRRQEHAHGLHRAATAPRAAQRTSGRLRPPGHLSAACSCLPCAGCARCALAPQPQHRPRAPRHPWCPCGPRLRRELHGARPAPLLPRPQPDAAELRTPLPPRPGDTCGREGTARRLRPSAAGSAARNRQRPRTTVDLGVASAPSGGSSGAPRRDPSARPGGRRVLLG